MLALDPLAIARATSCSLLLALGLPAAAADMVPLPTGDPAQAMAEAAAFLRTSVFPAEFQFQAGGYVDPDGNRRGAYALLPELAGGTVANGQGRCQRPLAFLPDAFADPEAVVGGWRYAVILPGDPALRQSAATLPDLARTGARGEDSRERYFACLA
jgi:hypothetical protein